ncbi:YopX family protein [Lactococcus lactis subsp. lactis]|uniref:YopX family protein n=1 Tax=Lactococcus lactis TaxID=1358 RepID=UPI002647244D|nr:YopX family protein [Lactococcus lactis]WKB49219.1 YopX family protein [Lactococcus lactis subsp. lactis]
MIPEFRVWDKKTKSMWNIERWHVEDEYFDLIEPNKNVADPNANRVWRNQSDVILMQSTGLKDKNGVEIYEGDILKLHAIFLAPDDKIGYIEYSPKYGYSIIFEGNRLYRQEYWASTNKLNYEVIGNIYDNPELLEGHEK